MHFHTITGKTRQEAQAKVLAEMGEEAILYTTRNLGSDGFEIVCIVDAASEGAPPVDGPRLAPEGLAYIVRAFRWHHVSTELAEALLDKIAEKGGKTPQAALILALTDLFAFQTPTDRILKKGRRLALLGVPGVGKTTLLVKLALVARAEGLRPAIICADELRLAAQEQIGRYGEKLAVPVYNLSGSKAMALSERVAKSLTTLKQEDIVFIDTPGVNPFSATDVQVLEDICLQEGVTTALVLSTLVKTESSDQLIRSFSRIPSRSVFLTQQDIDRRLGSVLEVAWRYRLALNAVSVRPNIVGGVQLLDAKKLADFMLQDTPLEAPRIAMPPGGSREGAALGTGAKTESEKQPVPAAASSPVLPPAVSPAVSSAVPPVPAGAAGSAGAPEGHASTALRPSAQASIRASDSGELPSDAAAASPAIPRTGCVRAVASGKGGVGKTFFAISLACSLAGFGRKVLLFDGDLGTANLDIQLGLSARHDLLSVIRRNRRLEDIITPYARGGFDVLVGRSGSGTLAGLPVSEVFYLREQLRALAHRYDDILMDLGAGIDRTVQTLIESSDHLLVVTNKEPTSLTDAYGLIKLIHRLRPLLPQHLIVNHATNTGAGESTYRSLFQTCKRFLNYAPAYGGCIRKDSKAVKAIQRQIPLLLLYPESTASLGVHQICRTLLESEARKET